MMHNRSRSSCYSCVHNHHENPATPTSGMRGSTFTGSSGGGGKGRGCAGEGSAASECSGLRSPSPTGPPTKERLRRAKKKTVFPALPALLLLPSLMPVYAHTHRRRHRHTPLSPAPLTSLSDSYGGVPPKTISEAPDRKEFPERTE